MKKKKMTIFGASLFALAFIAAPQITNAEVRINSDITTKQNFTDNVILDSDITIKEGAAIVANGDITIDLNGHTITKEGEINLRHAYYAIEVKTGKTVTLKNGNVTCSSPTDSCVRNYGSLNIEGINVKSNFHSVKNEEASTITITGSKLEATGAGAASIQNYGNAKVTESELIANGDHAAAIYNLTYQDYSSRIETEKTKINATKAVETYYDDGSSAPTLATTKNEVILGDDTEILVGKVNIRPVPNSQGTPASLELNGNVKAPISYLEYATNGTVLTLNSSISAGNYEIPAGVKVVIGDNVKGHESANFTGEGTVIYDIMADYSALNVAMNAAYKIDKSKYTKESVKVLEDALARVVMDKKINEQDEVDKMTSDILEAIKTLKPIDEVIDENPKTMDNILLYVGMGVCVLLVVGFVSKKVLLDN